MGVLHPSENYQLSYEIFPPGCLQPMRRSISIQTDRMSKRRALRAILLCDDVSSTVRSLPSCSWLHYGYGSAPSLSIGTTTARTKISDLHRVHGWLKTTSNSFRSRLI